MILSLCIVISYLGWVAAQVTALGLVFNVLSYDVLTQTQGMLIGAAVVGAIGRNPEIQGKILSTAFIMIGLVDAVLAFVLLIVFTTN